MTVITGDNGDNWLVGTPDNDKLYGMGGNDQLVGGLGDDDLFGGPGDDVLDGGPGHNRLHFGRGDGHDFVATSYQADQPLSHNTIVLDGLTPADVVVQRMGDMLDVSIAGTGDHITAPSVFGNHPDDVPPSVEAVRFADGTTWNVVDLQEQAQIGGMAPITLADGDDVMDGPYVKGMGGDDHLGTWNGVLYGGDGNDHLQAYGGGVLHGDAGNDTLLGSQADDVLDGGSGNDVLDGGGGHDTFIWGRGGGQDIVLAQADSYNNAQGHFMLTGVAPGMVQVTRAGADDLVLSIKGTGDTLTIEHYFSVPTDMNQRSFVFDNGQVWTAQDIANHGPDTGVTVTGTDGPDNLQGQSGNDVLIGGAGNDTLVTWTGDNTLLGGDGWDQLQGGSGDDYIDGGPGNDVIHDLGGSNMIAFGRASGFDTFDDWTRSTNVVVLDADVRPEDVQLTLIGGRDLRIAIGGQAELVLTDYAQAMDQGQAGHVTLRFADHVQWDSDLMIAHLMTGDDGQNIITGTNGDNVIDGKGGDDVLDGAGGNDIIRGGDGNDWLYGGDGNDVLSGGPGDDMLIDHSGSNTFLVQLGDQREMIDTSAGPGEVNTIRFGAGISASSLHWAVDGQLLHIAYGVGDEILLNNFDPAHGMLPVDRFVFDDQTTLTYDQLVTLIGAPAPLS